MRSFIVLCFCSFAVLVVPPTLQVPVCVLAGYSCASGCCNGCLCTSMPCECALCAPHVGCLCALHVGVDNEITVNAVCWKCVQVCGYVYSALSL